MALKQACFLSAEEANLGRLDVSTRIHRISMHLALSLTETDICIFSKLMKIGEVLDYRCLMERGGKLPIEQGMEAWAAYVRTQWAFLVSWATQ